MVAKREVGGPIAADDEQTCRRDALREVREHVDRGEVAPVQILDDEDQRLIRCERLERLAELAQHAIAIRVPYATVEGLGRRPIYECGDLYQPARRPALECRGRR